MGFDHQRFKVYLDSLLLFAAASRVAKRLPRAMTFIADQLLRASLSISLNIAEGAGEFSRSEKCRFYRMARRSAAECSAILDAIAAANLIPADKLAPDQAYLQEIAAILTGLIRNIEKSK